MEKAIEFMNIRTYMSQIPNVLLAAWIDPTAIVIGNTIIGNDSSVWPASVIRGDVHSIIIGSETNIQDGAVLHCTHDGPFFPGGFPLSIGNQVTVGHKACLHGCKLGNRVLVGIGTIILDGAQIEDDVILAAGTLVPPKKKLSSGWLYMGTPAMKHRKLEKDDLKFLEYSAKHYVKLAQQYKKDFVRRHK